MAFTEETTFVCALLARLFFTIEFMCAYEIRLWKGA